MFKKKTGIVKRIIALFLGISFMNVSVYAINSATLVDKIEALDVKEQLIENEDALLLTGVSSTQLIPNSIEYSYTITSGSRDGMVKVNMLITLDYATKNSTFEVAGEIPVLELPSGDKYMYGPLEGEMNLDGRTYKTTVGFQKMSGNSDISATLTIKCDDSEAIFEFGDLHVKYEIVKEVLLGADTENAATSSTNAASNGDYEYLAQNTASLNGMRAIREEVLYDAGKRRLMLTVFPYLQNLESIHTVPGTTTASVSVNRINMEISENNGTQTSISSVVRNGTDLIEENGGTVFDSEAIDVLAAIGSLKFPEKSPYIATFLAIVRALIPDGAKTEIHQYADMITAEYSGLDLKDKTWDEYGLSIACQLIKSEESSPTVTVDYHFWSEIRYDVVVTDFMGDVSHVYRTAEVDKDYPFTTS